jgi:hypothetical protein
MLIAIDPFYVLSGFLIALNSRPISGKTKPVRVGREPAQEAVPALRRARLPRQQIQSDTNGPVR